MAATNFTVADVLAWARTKPADEAYEYYNVCGCAMAQFCDAFGLDWLGTDGACNARSRFEVEYRPQLSATPHTFGALVARLEALCPETPVTKSDWLAIDTYLNADCGKVEA